MIRMIFKTRFSNEGSGKNVFSRFENNDPASDDYPKDDPSWTLDDCVSHFAKLTPDREKSESQRVRRADNIYYLTRRTPKYQYKSSNRTSYYEKTNRTMSLRQGIIRDNQNVWFADTYVRESLIKITSKTDVVVSNEISWIKQSSANLQERKS